MQFKLHTEHAKNTYYLTFSTKLSHPKTSPKAFWLILEGLLNDKKIPIILPLYHNNKCVTDIMQKTKLFHSTN